ncbi:hypothetical protein OG689_30020 [Kitasatospora sp. NBC_00240]|uniref:WXG100 family type VII secretion target n=1 Tax=Kitasatospora sp. NBC_00240 TaxID=2903567 RepID=UPI0022501A4A|nr:hypothetical protein [Kitasatospora sp. NBC_00240]MCX5213455.1 hypothetical protein [Kitasatospora sp. NBC_00240]
MEDLFRTKVHEPGGARPPVPVPASGLETATPAARPSDAGPSGAGTATMLVERAVVPAPAAPAAGADTAAAAASTGPAAAKSAGTGFTVAPEQYRAAASPVLAASDRLSRLYLGLDEYLTSMNATEPWGGDHAGEQFAQGEKGYLAYSAATLKGLKTLAPALHRIAEGLKAMAQNYENAESGVVARLRGRGQDLVAAAPLPTAPNVSAVSTVSAGAAVPGPPVPAVPGAVIRDIGRGRTGGRH